MIVDFYYSFICLDIYWRGCQDTILPEGWVQVTHSCGMPLYLNRQARVCTISRPYFIAEQIARKHDIPISSIPCMAYKRRKEIVEKQIKEHNQAKLHGSQSVPNKCPFSGKKMPENPAESVNDANKEPDDSLSNANKPNKKVTVTIQTNEEKLKENLLGSIFC